MRIYLFVPCKSRSYKRRYRDRVKFEECQKQINSDYQESHILNKHAGWVAFLEMRINHRVNQDGEVVTLTRSVSDSEFCEVSKNESKTNSVVSLTEPNQFNEKQLVNEEATNDDVDENSDTPMDVDQTSVTAIRLHNQSLQLSRADRISLFY